MLRCTYIPCLFVRPSVRLSVRSPVLSSVRPSARLPFRSFSARPSVRLSVRPSVRPPVCPSVRPSSRLSVRPPVLPSVCPSVRPPVCLSVRLSVRPPVRLSLRPSNYPSLSSLRNAILSVRYAVTVCNSKQTRTPSALPVNFLSVCFLLIREKKNRILAYEWDKFYIARIDRSLAHSDALAMHVCYTLVRQWFGVMQPDVTRVQLPRSHIRNACRMILSSLTFLILPITRTCWWLCYQASKAANRVSRDRVLRSRMEDARLLQHSVCCNWATFNEVWR